MEIELNTDVEAIKAVLELYKHLSLDDLESFGLSEHEQDALAIFHTDATNVVEEFELTH